MSSNIRIKRVCQHCGKLFTARTTVTKCCSDDCAKRLYKKRQREANIIESNQQTSKDVANQVDGLSAHLTKVDPFVKLLIDIDELSAITCLSRRTLFRLMKDIQFPRLNIGRRLLFKKEDVLEYLTSKYENK